MNARFGGGEFINAQCELIEILVAVFRGGASREVAGDRCGDDHIDVPLHFNDLRAAASFCLKT
ncbi:hypothetical protein QWJ46_23290 [Rhizobium sp. CBN3]|uniref:hypothetical protein n=1 Tax=Rhizobium sp. CBN3 TaxID=3058045 RepID=UPI0026715769|nr:hypothetical protein [Rhizobium sp. CBN3]MDO3435600.1 hypothetical protein [Rhizobium sp. CBN3]